MSNSIKDNQDYNLSRPVGNLHQDSPEFDQPTGTYRYALNAIVKDCDGTSRSNEESNEKTVDIPINYIVLGNVYISNDEVILFLVSKDLCDTYASSSVVSKICLFNSADELIELVSDSAQEEKLGFSASHQIEATYRLRRGCEQTIYWTDNNNKPMYFVLNKDSSFQDSSGLWVKEKFYLIPTYDGVPSFDSIEVRNSGGTLQPGSQEIFIQYLDESLNATDFVVGTGFINIYKSSTNTTYSDITGCVNTDEDNFSQGKTSKSIYLKISNLDTNFTYYRLAVVQRGAATGDISAVYYTSELSTEENEFIWTGTNYSTTGTVSDINAVTDKIEKAKTIEQIENRLILGNTKGKSINYCKLQKYASMIAADCVVKEVECNIMSSEASKNPLVRQNGGVGYMPGETYSFGIVYILSDGTYTPVYHIPGKSSTNPGVPYLSSTMETIRPMSYTHPTTDTQYSTRESCSGDNADYWGTDCDGNSLEGTTIRHHTFPSRRNLEIPLIEQTSSTTSTTSTSYLELTLKIEVASNSIDKSTSTTASGTYTLDYKVAVYNKDNDVKEYDYECQIPVTITTDTATSGTATVSLQDFTSVDNISYIRIYEVTDSTTSTGEGWSDDDGEVDTLVASTLSTDSVAVSLVLADSTSTSTSPVSAISYYLYNESASTTEALINSSISLSTYLSSTTTGVDGRTYTTKILGIKFSNIYMPKSEDLSGETVIGYMIVRNQRDEINKTILDSAVLLPMEETDSSHGDYSAVSFSMPEHDSDETDHCSHSKKNFNLVCPQNKFLNKNYSETDISGDTAIQQEGYFNLAERYHGKICYNDVVDGSSYNSSTMSSSFGDSDGMSLKVLTRDNTVYYSSDTSDTFTFKSSQVKRIAYLDAYDSLEDTDQTKTIYNISADNKVAILSLAQNLSSYPSYVCTSDTVKIPYVLLKRELSPYENFRDLPYVSCSNITLFKSNADVTSTNLSVYQGDSYVTPMKYISSTMYGYATAYRKAKTSWTSIFLDAAAIIAGVVISIASWGTGTAAAIAVVAGVLTAVGGALELGATIIDTDKFQKALNEEYSKGLKYAIRDTHTNYEFGGDSGPLGYRGWIDDMILFHTDSISYLWFDTQVNMDLRNKIGDTQQYMEPFDSTIKDGYYGTSMESTKRRSGTHVRYLKDTTLYPQTSLDSYVKDKFLTVDSTRGDGYKYGGTPLPELYYINQDFIQEPNSRKFYHLALEYSCCSQCKECFAQRLQYSEQSFAEELSDNYRVFLTNNYSDIEGETGEVTKIFRFRDSLFILTEEALWKVATNYQEKTTSELTTYIGTGDFLSIPPIKILDSATGQSSGCRHQWSFLKTPYGIFYISEKQKEVIYFDGQSLRSISNIGLQGWFRDNIPLLMDKNYSDENSGEEYEYRDNPSNDIGTGFISVFDADNSRVIITKKDFGIASVKDTSGNTITLGSDYKIVSYNNTLILFQNYNATISAKEADGYDYLGVVDGVMKFQKSTTTTISSETCNGGCDTDNGYELNTVTLNCDKIVTKSSSGGDSIKLAKGDTVGRYCHKGVVFYDTSLSIGTTLRGKSVDTKDVPGITDPDTYESGDGFFSDPDKESTRVPCTIFSEGTSVTYIHSNNATSSNGCTVDPTSTDSTLTTPYPAISSDTGATNRIPAFANPYGTETITNRPTYGRLNQATVWSSSVADGNWVLPFYKCINTKDGCKYCIGVAADNGFRVYITNNTLNEEKKEILSCSGSSDDSTLYDNYYFYLYWHIFSLNLDDNTTYTIEIQGYNKDDNASYGLDIYNVDIETLKKVEYLTVDEINTKLGTSYTDLSEARKALIQSYINFSTEDTTNATYNTGTVCDEGYEYNYCYNGYPMCVKVEDSESQTNCESGTYIGITTTTVPGTVITQETLNNSWTISYSFDQNSWISWHSYLPSLYVGKQSTFYSWVNGINGLWKHGIEGNYQTYYGTKYAFIIEYVSNGNGTSRNPIDNDIVDLVNGKKKKETSSITTKIYDFIRYWTEARKYVSGNNEYVDQRFITFNKAWFYNSRQNTGELSLVVKDTMDGQTDYMKNVITDFDNNVVVIDRNEKDWSINDIRDIVVDYTVPRFDKSLTARSANYFCDKVINPDSIDVNKVWYQRESLRDKYLTIRLIFDNFTDVKLIFNYSIESNVDSTT